MARKASAAMYDMRWIRDNADLLKEALRARGWEGLRVEEIVANLFALDDRRRDAIGVAQKGQEERNRLSKEIGVALGRKEAAEAERLKTRVAELRQELARAEGAEKEASAALETALLEIPNLPLEDVPPGLDERDNVEQRVVGAAPSFADGFAPKEHFELGEALGLMDFEAASRMSGARFVVLKGALARLERALGQFMLDLHTQEHGYAEVSPPLLVRDAAMYGTAQLPKFRDDQFAVGEDFWLIPTAEVPLTNLAREQILEEQDLPIRVTALTPCFRAEAGAAGRDTRGMIRQHQFSKVELVSVVRPQDAGDEHERMTACAEQVLKKLDLRYRVMALCAGDMGFASRKTYDLEVWLPGQGRFREISSCSQCGEFQARRMSARFRAAGVKTPSFVHTLNGSGVAVGRALVAILENYQNPDGSITVPEALRPYMAGMQRIAGEQTAPRK
jgi:seryl-tRNA synthetase